MDSVFSLLSHVTKNYTTKGYDFKINNVWAKSIFKNIANAMLK